MPAPSTSLVPKQEYWGFVQKDISPAQLKLLATNIVASDNLLVDDTLKRSILNFLTGDQVEQWSDYWVTIINTLGFAYTTSDGVIHKTKMADYISEGRNLNEFFLFWSLFFQFPFAESKHREYKENNIVVNPAQILLTALVYLIQISKSTGNKDPFREAFLTAEEIVLVLMKSNSNSTLGIIEKVNLIYQNRVSAFNYNTIKIQGHDTIISNFTGRARLYLEKSEIIKFSADSQKVLITNWQHYVQCLNYLSFRKEGVKIKIGSDEADRIRYFEESYNGPTSPNDFFKKVHSFDHFINETNVLEDEVQAVTNKLLVSGNHFTEEFVERFLLCAKAKPFIILSGISGVGKSLLPKALMKILENNSCRPISVSPDWTDNSDMLGYFGHDGKFVPGEFTNIVLDASKNLHLPYFIVLDEMNLAKVEYYFAQVLSVMESRYFDDLKGSSSYFEFLFNDGTRKRLALSADTNENILASLKIPPNLVIVGTVNIDESTHPFSKKVLDRANVLEINEVDLRIGISGLTNVLSNISIIASSKYLVGTISTITELHEQWRRNFLLEIKYPFSVYIDRWISALEKFNSILSAHHLNFGLRMRDEVCIYLYYAAIRNLESTNSEWDDKYIDHQLIQKVLTRLEGEEGELEESILEMFKLCLKDSSSITEHESVVAYSMFNDPNTKYPLTAIKLQKMLRALIVNRKPMVSFWTC